MVIIRKKRDLVNQNFSNRTETQNILPQMDTDLHGFKNSAMYDNRVEEFSSAWSSSASDSQSKLTGLEIGLIEGSGYSFPSG